MDKELEAVAQRMREASTIAPTGRRMADAYAAGVPNAYNLQADANAEEHGVAIGAAQLLNVAREMRSIDMLLNRWSDSDKSERDPESDDDLVRTSDYTVEHGRDGYAVHCPDGTRSFFGRHKFRACAYAAFMCGNLDDGIDAAVEQQAIDKVAKESRP